MSTQPRQPAGVPSGGQFAVTGRNEPLLRLATEPLSGPEAEADALLAESVMDAAKLNSRIDEVRGRLAEARNRQLTAARLPDRDEDHLFWSERALAAEEDLADLRTMHDRTVVGLAALTARHDQALRNLTAFGAGLHPVDGETYEATREELHRATDALEGAVDPELELVFGADDMPDHLHERWAGVGMVAAPVVDPDDVTPTAWRVSFVDVRAGAELGRVTVPAAHAVDHREPGRLDKAAIVEHVTFLADHAGSAAARALVEHLEPPTPRAA